MSHSPDRDRFMELVDGHGAALMAMLRKLCRNPHDAEEMFQETAIRVWRNIGTQSLRNPRSWLLTIGYRTFIDCHARHRRPAVVEIAVDEPIARSRDPGDIVEFAESSSRIQTAIGELSPPIREVVVLHYVGGLSLSETATAMEISPGTVKSRLNSALTQLRSVLE